MSDLISRQAAIDAVMALMPSLTTADGSGQFDAEIYRVQELFVDIGQVLNDLPSAEAEPVKHGRWINDNHRTKCSLCGTPIPIRKVILGGEVMWENNNPINYCPNCGAKMDAEEGETHEIDRC